MNCKETIKSIKFEEDSEIMSINNYSFYETNIESADLSNCNHLTLLNESVFSSCRRLKSVFLPPDISSIGKYCFYNNDALTSIDLPDSVETIYEYSFGDSGLTSINISKNSKLAKLDQRCFSMTKLLTFFIPKSLNEISSSAFGYCESLENITVDPENKYYRSDFQNIFTGTDNSTLFRVFKSYSESQYIVPSYITNISDWCFSYVNISSIQLHRKITSIRSSTFSFCKSLKSITIPESVTSIGDSAFSFCESLISITIPESVTSIGSYAFNFCSSLTSITIPDNVTSIEACVFSYCELLENFTIPKNVIYIYYAAFEYCTSLTNIIIPESVTLIDNNAFSYCTSLVSIIISASVTSISIYAFLDCESLTNITFLSSFNARYISSWSFASNQNQLNIFIPGKFILNNSYDYTNIFQYGSNLYITSQTVLSYNCKDFFGGKTFHVHFDNTTKLSDQTTVDVLKLISIEDISIPLMPKTIHNNIYYESKLFHLTNFFISLNIRAAS